MLEFFLPTFVTLFVIADPVGTAVIFLGLSQGYSDEQIKSVVRRATLIAGGIMIAFGLLGQYILPVLGVSIPAFRIAGGLLLSVTAYRMVMGQREKQRARESTALDEEHEDIAVFPLAIPLLSGPGCMTASILLMDQADDTFIGTTEVIAGMIAVQVVSYFALRYAPNLSNMIGKTGTSILARVMGVILAAMSVQFIADGIRSI
ncbi:MAG: MarC family protein [Bdellovibrionales bacterium]